MIAKMEPTSLKMKPLLSIKPHSLSFSIQMMAINISNLHFSRSSGPFFLPEINGVPLRAVTRIKSMNRVIHFLQIKSCFYTVSSFRQPLDSPRVCVCVCVCVRANLFVWAYTDRRGNVQHDCQNPSLLPSCLMTSHKNIKFYKSD